MADEQTSAFFAPADSEPPVVTDEPILLAPAPDMTDFAAAPTDFAAPPTTDAGFLGEVDAAVEETPMQLPEDGAILLGAPPAELPVEPVEAALPEPVEEEPAELSPMAKWNQEWQVTLRERKDAENAAKAEAVETAHADLAAFQAERELKREAKMAKNRSDEQEKLEAIEADLENDNSWQRVVKMVELNHDSSEGSADVGRMKDVMIFLKNEPDRALVLA